MLFHAKKIFLKEPNPQMSCVQFTSAFFHQMYSCVVFTCTLFSENALIPTYLPTYLHTYLPTYLPTHPPTNLPTYLHCTYPSTNTPTYLPIYLPACQYLAGALSRADHHVSCKKCSRTLTCVFYISLMREQCAMF